MAKKQSNTQIYMTNKKLKVGDTCVCPICHNQFVKKQYSQAFCSISCKNTYHNRKGDRHKPNYYDNYNAKHPHRLDFVRDLWWEEEGQYIAMCENPQLGI